VLSSVRRAFLPVPYDDSPATAELEIPKLALSRSSGYLPAARDTWGVCCEVPVQTWRLSSWV
jgi:hypothetical protein